MKHQNYKLIKFLYTLFNFYSVIYDIKYHVIIKNKLDILIKCSE